MNLRIFLAAVFLTLSWPAAAADTFSLVRATVYDAANNQIFDSSRGDFSASGTATLDGSQLTIVRTITEPGFAPVQTTNTYTIVTFTNNVATLRDQFNVQSELALIAFPIPTIILGQITDITLNSIAAGTFPAVEQWMLSSSP